MLLSGKLYDPSVAVTKSTASLLAMTALDTTNLRLTFPVPPSGSVLVRLRGVIHGGTAAPQILFGVMSGAAIVGRMAPELHAVTMAATSLIVAEATLLVVNLPGGAQTWDAAYAVETLVASSAIKYGGPNNALANDAFGGFAFEVWSA